MLRIKEGNIIASLPRNSVFFIDYPLLFILMLFTKLLFCRALVINLPLPIQYPFIFYHWQGNLPFIDFAEMLKRFFGLTLYWEIKAPLRTGNWPANFYYPSLDFLPKTISLTVDIDKFKRAKREMRNLLISRKNQIKMICYHHQLKTFPSVNKLSAFLMRNSLVLW